MTLIPIMIPLQALGQAPPAQPAPMVGLPWELVRRGFADYLNHTATVSGKAISRKTLEVRLVSRATRIASTVTSLYARTLSHLYIEQIQVETVARAFRIINTVASYRSRGYYRHSLSKRLRKRAGRKLDYE